MQKTNNDVSNLNAGVVDVVLHFDAIAGGFQDAHKRVAEHSVANVTDVRRFVRIDAGVLDHLLWSLDDLLSSASSVGPANMPSSFARSKRR